MGNFNNELHNYSNVPRELVFDSSLSDRARFVYVFMACKPEGWEFFLDPMVSEIGYSKETLRKYIAELVEHGWLIKEGQQMSDGKFGAVKYTLVASKKSDAENFRLGNNQAQRNTNISIPNTKETYDKEIKKEETKENTKVLKKDLFEECWVAYRRKGIKKRAKEYWNKLNDEEMDMVMPHIKAYVSSRDVQYQKDFERYLRDRVFLEVVYNGNNIIYDPTKNSGETESYMPTCGGALQYNDYYKCYLHTGYWGGYIPDGYTDDNRPDGASVMLNNARGTVVWHADSKKWEIKK